MSGLFSSKKTTPEVAVLADPYKNVRESVNSWVTSNMGQPGPQYSGQFVAPESELEKASLPYLQAYGARDTSKPYAASREMLEKTLTGGYDPTKSPYYQAVKAEAQRNLEDTQKGIASDAAGGGRYWTGARLQEQGRAGTDVANNLNTILGQLAENERQREMQAAPMAAELGTQEGQEPLKTAAAYQEYGALPREIQQAYDTAVYNEWVNSMRNWPLQVAGIGAGVQQAPLYGQVGYQPSMFEKLMSSLAPAAGQAISSKLFK